MTLKKADNHYERVIPRNHKKITTIARMCTHAGAFGRRHQAQPARGAVRAGDCRDALARETVLGLAFARHVVSRAASYDQERENLRRATCAEFSENRGRSPENAPENGWCSRANAEPTQRLHQLGDPLVDASAPNAAHERSLVKPPAFARFCAGTTLPAEIGEPLRRAAMSRRGRGAGPKRGL